MGDKYRAGVFYIGLWGYRIGVNSEFLRAAVQNTVHFLMGKNENGQYDSPYFKYLSNRSATLYWYDGSSTGDTLW